MYKSHFFTFKLKSCILPIIFSLFTVSLLIFSSSNINAAKNGLKLWGNCVIPSIFPFFVATELLSKTNIPIFLGKIFNNLMKPLFNIRGEGSFAIIMGFISGYPVGAKIASDFRKRNLLSKEECERLLSFTNTSGPLFIIGTIGISFFGNIHIGFLLLITHLLSALTVGFIFKLWKSHHGFNQSLINNPKTTFKLKEDFKNSSKNISLSNLGKILSESISNAISTTFMVGGFIVIFSVIVSIFNNSRIFFGSI